MAKGNLIPSKNLVGTTPSSRTSNGVEVPIEDGVNSRGIVGSIDPNPTSLQLEIDKTKPVGAITTERAKSDLQAITKAHDFDMKNIAVGNSGRTNTSQQIQESAVASDRSSGALSAEELASLGVDMNQYTYNPNSGLYVPSATQGVIDEFKTDKEELDKLFTQQQGMLDATTSSLLSSIKQEYNDLANEQRDLNKASERSFESFSVRNNIGRYTGERAQGLKNSVISAGIKSLRKIAGDEFAMLMKAENARNEKNFSLFSEYRDDLKKLRSDKTAKLLDLQKEIRKQSEDAAKAKIQASRDGAIGDLIKQGITDANQILNLLNYDDSGNLIGDFTAKEIKDTLTKLSPGNDLEKLSGATRDFYILKGNNGLPNEITSLPEEQQMFAFLRMMKNIPGSSSNKGNTITYSEAVTRGLPKSVVGMSEEEVAQSLFDIAPPPWFEEKLRGEIGGFANPGFVKDIWSEYRKEKLKETGKTKNEDKPVVSTSSGRTI